MLTQVLPHPPDSGPKVKTAAVLGYLTRHHEVTLISFTRGEQAEDLRTLRQVCRQVHGVPIRRGRLRDACYLGRSLAGGEPFLMARDARAAMVEVVRRRLATDGGFDLVHADQLNMAQYARLAPPRTARILDAHNALWLVTERLARTLPFSPRRLLLAREARLLRAYEGRVCREFEGVLAVSDDDLRALREAAAAPIEAAVVPIAIDVAAVTPIQPRAGGDRLLYLGSLIWPPSLDGLLWFLDEVLPRLRARRPSVAIDVVGANPPSQLLARAARDGGVRVHGYVADPSALLSSASAMVVPLRAGGGMRVRILNGLAQGVPIVTTTIGAEGIALESGRHLLVADGAEDFAAAALRLLEDADYARSLAKEGRRLVEERYDARVVCAAIDDLYERAVASARR